jgi:hypothetical protein
VIPDRKLIMTCSGRDKSGEFVVTRPLQQANFCRSFAHTCGVPSDGRTMRIECTAVSDVLKAYLLAVCSTPPGGARQNLADPPRAPLCRQALWTQEQGRTWDTMSVGCQTM